MAGINFAVFPFCFPASFYDLVPVPPEPTSLAIFTFTFPAYFVVEPTVLTIFPFAFPAYFYEAPV